MPSEAEIKAVLDRIRDHFVRSTPYRIIDTATGQPITDLSTPVKTAGIDNRNGEFNDWTYSMGVVLAAMLQVTEVTGDTTLPGLHVQELRLHLHAPPVLPPAGEGVRARRTAATAA